MNTRICVLGENDARYTRLVIVELDKQQIDYDLILVKPATEPHAHTFIGRSAILLNTTIQAMYTGPFKVLSKTSFFFWKAFISHSFIKRTKQYREMMKLYNGLSFVELIKDKKVFYTKDINHVDVYTYLAKQDYEIGVLAGVDIVSGSVIGCFKRFCLNAHPAPLPECRGAGALENTLNYGLAPSATVHLVTDKIDGGDILRIYPVPVYKNDSFNLLSARLGIICAISIADVLSQILKGKIFTPKPNIGKLHYWKDCTQAIQVAARKNFEKLKRK